MIGNVHPPEQTRNSPDLATKFLCCGQVSRVLQGLEVIDFGGNIDRNSTQKNLLFYNGQEQSERYRSFLLWLFSTFNTDEESFRKMLLSRLAIPQVGKVLVTGCGNDDDLAALAKHYPSGVWTFMLKILAPKWSGKLPKP